MSMVRDDILCVPGEVCGMKNLELEGGALIAMRSTQGAAS